ncbi:MAG: DUF5777 family beta-barrel protein [Chitinophagales bacterium]|jgi:hypothetical protein
MNKLLLLFSTVLLGSTSLWAQDDLLDLLGEEETINYATNSFKGTRVVNAQSMEMLHPGTMDFRILHRFGRVDQGYYQLFGLDQASMRMGFDFGLSKNLMVGIGRSTTKKEVDGLIKYRLLWQSKGKRNIPVSVLALGGVTVNGLKDAVGNPAIETTFSRRLAYFYSVIVGRKFNERLSLQLSPTLIHQNIVINQLNPNTLYAVGFGGRMKLNKRIAVIWDYSHVFNRFPGDIRFNPLSIGFDIETGGHVFQLHFSNAVGMNERAFLVDNNSNFFKGQVQFGFNLSRVFQLKKQPS